MNPLQPLRERLLRLRLFRTLARGQIAFAQVCLVVVILLVLMFAVDFSWHLSIVGRVWLLGLGGSLLLVQVVRQVLAAWGERETLVDLALVLERRHRVDSDLVAALQFNAPANARWGSPQLANAVVQRAADLATQLDYRAALPMQVVRRHRRRALTAIALLAATSWLWPEHARAFTQRLLLRDVPYPTRTQIEDVLINGQSYANRGIEADALTFQVRCSGDIPDRGTIVVRGVTTGASTQLELKPSDDVVPVDLASGVFVTEIPQLDEAVEYSIRLGDARTVARRIEVIPRPRVELKVTVTPPAYTQLGATQHREHFLHIVEGSAVQFDLQSVNDKRLMRAELVLTPLDTPGHTPDFAPTSAGTSLPFVQQDAAGRQWRLPGAAVPLARVTRGFQYRIELTDEDGLSTYFPIVGAMRLRPDQIPMARIQTTHQLVVPSAVPVIHYDVDDDFSIGKVVLHVHSQRHAGATGDQGESLSVPVVLEGTPLDTTRLPHQGEIQLDLSRLTLEPGDLVEVSLEVTDHRGDWPGASFRTDSLALSIADERAAVAAILQQDEEAERLLSEAIRLELGGRSEP